MEDWRRCYSKQRPHGGIEKKSPITLQKQKAPTTPPPDKAKIPSSGDPNNRTGSLISRSLTMTGGPEKRAGQMSWQRFGTNSSLLAIATIALAFLQWAILIFIARVDGPSLLGEYSLAQAYAGSAFFFGSLSLRSQYLVLEPSRSLFSDFLFLRLFFPAVVFGCLLTFIYFYHTSPSFFLIAAAIFAMKYVEGLFDLASGKMQREGDFTGVATTNITRCLISIFAFGTIYLATANLPLALFFLSLFWIVFLLIHRDRLSINVQLSEVLTADNFKGRIGLALSLFPFSVSLIVNALALNAPRFILDGVLGPKELGFFTAVSHFLGIGALAVGSIAQTALPSLADAIAKHSIRKFWQRLLWPAALVQCACIVGVIIAIAMGPELLDLFYGREFESQGHTLVVATIVAGPIYCSFIFVNGCYAAQMRRGLVAIQCLSLLVVISATWIFVVRFGVDGAFLGLVMFAITQIILSVALLLRFFSQWPRVTVIGCEKP
jgi:O-antigen/teichoic acid export membrane protein